MSNLILSRKLINRSLYTLDSVLGNKPKIFVLCYHSISSDWQYGVSLSNFKKQINYLQTFCKFITPDEFEKYLNSKLDINFPSVLLTFDDGYEDVLKIKDFLRKKNIKPLMFLLADTRNVNRIEVATHKKLLTSSQIRSLKLSGWQFGSHGMTHSDFLTLTPDQIKKEISESKTKLTQQFGPIKYFAYPKGRFTSSILKQISKADYKLAFGMNDDHINRDINKLEVPRVGINKTHDLEEFKTLFSPSVILFRKACKSIKLERAFS